MNKLSLAILVFLAACTTEEPIMHGPTLAQVHWRCPGGKSFGAHVGTEAVVFAAGHTYRLAHARSASGLRYESGGIEYWEHAGQASLHGAAGGPYENCRHG